MKRVLLRLLVALHALLFCALAQAAVDHAAWDGLLKKHVHLLRGGQASQVDYTALAAERPLLKGYLAELSAIRRADFDSWPPTEQLAFLINAYNAWTVDLILAAWPDIKSIKEQGSLLQSPWKKRFIPLLGETRSLDDIEHGLIRGSGRYAEPRIHFAVNCASIGCPALRNEAYRASSLEGQLEAATRSFLVDRTRNRLAGTDLELSSIFKWYQADFAQEWRGSRSLPQFLARYRTALGLTEKQTQDLLSGRMDIVFLDYDWRLNARE